jgi:SAM-dependent methyltransferase
VNLDFIADMWRAYRQREVDRTLHPDDHMFNTAVRGWTDYDGVAASGMEVICTVLASAPASPRERILDFGCGHGRLARHLRAMMPDAELFFCDIDEDAAKFCAETFNGTAVPSTDSFSELELPGDLDLIWVGSVFTHIDHERMLQLHEKLFESLSENGVLIATFRGENMYRTMLTEGGEYSGPKWRPLIEQYEAEGTGYMDYWPERPGWGLSLTSIDRVVELGSRFDDCRLIGYSEAGWAAAHDVAAWTRHVHVQVPEGSEGSRPLRLKKLANWARSST